MNATVTRILIISDRLDERAHLRRLLQDRVSEGYQISEAGDRHIGAELIRAQTASPFACVLLREHLSNSDAYEVFRQLRTAAADRPCAVIVLADAGSSNGPDFLQAGAQDYLVTDALTSDRLAYCIDLAIEREMLAAQKQPEYEALKQSDRRFRALLEVAPDATLILDQHGRIVLANAMTREVFGYADADLPGQHVEILMPAAQQDPDDEHSQWLLTEPGPLKTGRGRQLTGIRRDGTEFPMAVSLSPLETDHGVLVSCVMRDLTSQMEVEAALQVSEVRYRRLFEAAKDGILILDFNSGKIVDANPFMSGLLGYSHEEFVDRELWEIGLFDDRSANEEAVRRLQQDGYLRYEHLPLETSDGRRVEVEIVANAYVEGDHQVIQCNVRDITERSQMEDRLQVQAAALRDQHRRKDEFLAMLSHELRSPLAPIANAVQLLSLQEGSENRVQQQARNIIERQLGKLQHLVDDLLEVSRITSGRVQLRQEWGTAQSIVDGAVETVRSLIEQRRHSLTVSVPEEPLWLHGDPARLEQVLVNLLINAAKYTEEGGHVWLTVVRETEGCVFRVRDDGVGIAESLLPHVFDLFTQAEQSLDRSLGGLGIGLALARRLTELHGGTLDVHSQPGEGSEFIVRLPLPDIDLADVPKSSSRRDSSARGLRVLVVDDSVDTAMAFSMLLNAYGYDVKTAHDGVTAVQLAAEFHPEAAILDIGLPELDGYEVARRIRQQPGSDEIVLIALTGYGQDSDKKASFEAGFNYHLIKPAKFGQLLDILTSAGKSHE